jgi:activating signal cointegrator complex subunit 2
MKAEILRRAEEISDDDDDDDGDGRLNGKGKKNVGVAFEEELDLDGAGWVKILGDGEESNEDDHEDENGDEEGEEAAQLPPRQTSETVLEMAYLEDPKLFERDGQTRRSKSRADLKARTGMCPLQIHRVPELEIFLPQVGRTNKLRGGRSCWNVM